ncbi:MAG: SIR2 family protein [Bacteroidales bacterium]|nr:SIR2 family protein [Bacteroidales bacterium]
MNNNSKKRHIAFLLGAGFSMPVGMPTANVLNSIITSEIYNNIRLSFQDGEGNLMKSFILEKVLLESDLCGSFNYEQFFDLLTKEKESQLDEEKLLSFIERGLYGYLWKCSRGGGEEDIMKTNTIRTMYNELLKDSSNYSDYVQNVIQWYQDTIAKNLLVNTNNGKLVQQHPCYTGFINIVDYLVQQGYIIDIHTLNHDLILESLLSHTALKDKVCNGFGEEKKELFGRKYTCFDISNYNKAIRIYKLHGSIDMHELSSLGGNSTRQYIQVVDGYSDGNAFMMNNQLSASILPLFLTGKISKEKDYSKEPFQTLLSEFGKNISIAEKLIMVGYSGGDKGINAILDNNYKNWSQTYVISPNAQKHCLVQNKGAKAISKGIEELTTSDLESL